ncbi:hypothetical protein PF006_g28099 [Phytophthora fragariae]|uniref:Chromo domain-containing protein n=1 Tax=Phytophthora fragariae TaxID=53985 RepID=A0A6A3QHY4_9STRA|nr:hypothetical protein PF006_g28099 [Phytophthora fragariae]
MEDVAAVVEKQRQHIADIRDSLTNMYRELSAEAAKKRQQARDRRASKPGVSMALFTEGDFVLTAHVLSLANKLAVQWKGPKRIVKALSDYVFEVLDLMAPFAISTHHASRLKFYADASRNVTEDLVAQAMHADGGHLVSKLVKCRMQPETHTWEIQVEWIGLDPLEASWEPATIIYEDVPELVKRFVLRANSDAAQAMWASLTKTPAARQKSKPQRRRKGRG